MDPAIIRVLVLEQGPTGPVGPPNSLEIGTVTTSQPGDPADADITGAPPNQTLDLTLPRGDEGPQGPVGPAGPDGPQGPAGTVDVGTITVLTPDQDPDVANVGTSEAAVLDFDLPRAPTFAVGTVASVPFGDPTTVVDVGTDGDIVLDFDLQRGEDGTDGDDGDDGWTPILAIVTDGARRVQQVVDWAGGTGTKPATGDFVGPTGLVSDIALAVDIRGPEGPLSGGLSDLNDVTITDPQANETIAYDFATGFWFNQPVVAAVGGGNDQLFYLNDTNATTNYTLPSARNAMSAGPIEIDPGVVITVPSGSTLTVV